MWSQAKTNEAITLLKFYHGTSIDFSALHVRETLKNFKFPNETKTPLVFRWDPSEMPILRVDLFADIPTSTLTELTKKKIIPALERIHGVGKIKTLGEQTEEIHVQIDSEKLASQGLSLFHITQKIQKENIQHTIGNYVDGNFELSLKLEGQLKTIQDIENIPISISPKKNLYLKDIANIQFDTQSIKVISRVNQKPSIALAILKTHDGATLDVIQNVKETLEHFKTEYPILNTTISKDDGIYIQTSRKILFGNLWQGALLTVIFIFLFLRSAASTLIIVCTIPISLVGTFAFMKYFGVTQNVFSLAGITLAAGMVVDSSVVILENIYRHYFEEGKSASRAAVEGTLEVGMGVFTSVLTTLSIFIPIVVCIHGVIGILFNDIAFTFVVALSLSLIVGFTAIPCAAALLLKRLRSPFPTPHTHSEASRGGLKMLSKYASRIQNFYLNTLNFLLDHLKPAAICVLVIYAACLFSIVFLPGLDLIPLGEFKTFEMKMELPKSTAFDLLNTKTKEIENQLSQQKDIETFATTLQDNEASFFVTLKQGITSPKHIDAYLEKTRKNYAHIPESELHVLSIPKLDMTEGQGPDIHLVVRHPEFQIRNQLANALKLKLSEVPELLYIEASHEKETPSLHVKLDQEKLRRQNLTAHEISQIIYGNLEGIKASEITTAKEQKDFAIRVIGQDPGLRTTKTFENLKTLPLPAKSNGKNIILPLKEFATLTDVYENTQIQYVDHTPATLVGAHLKTKRRALSEIQSDIKKIIGTSHPEASNDLIQIESALKVLHETFSDLFLALVIAMILVYMILAAQFESFTQPFSLMLTLPLAAVGLWLGVMLWQFHLNVIVMLGIILLVGITVDTSILIIEYTNILRKRGMDRKEALLLAVKHRMRPIFITALTDIFGTLPMAFSSGAGAEMYQGFGVTTVFGMTSATLLTLLALPLTYAFFEDLGEYFQLKWLQLKTWGLNKEETS